MADMDKYLDEDFLSLFKGKFDISTIGQGVKQAFDYLKGMDRKARCLTAQACMSFASKPLRYTAKGLVVVPGQVKDEEDAGRERKFERKDGFSGFDGNVLKYLPKLTGEEVKAMHEKQKLDGVRPNKGREGPFGDVNVSMCRRIALINIALFPGLMLADQWIRKHGGTPQSCPLPHEPKEEHKKIFVAQMTHFRAEWELVNTSEWRQMFETS